MATSRSTFALGLSLVTAVATGPARAEYASQGIEEAQGLKQVITDTKAPISPEVMAAVVAKVKANPGLTAALIQANPRFKKILGIGDNSPAIPSPAASSQPTVVPPVAYAPVTKRPPTQEALRLTETLSQVNSILNGETTTVIASRPARGKASVGEQENIPDTNRFGEPLTSATGRRLLGKLETRRDRSTETLELKRKILLQKERKYARLSNATGGSALQASLEFNRGVRGAVSPRSNAKSASPAANNNSGYALAMRDISETEEANAPAPSSLRRRKIIGGENLRARPVTDTEETDLVPHKYVYSPSTLKEGDMGGGGAMGDAIRSQQSGKNTANANSQNGQSQQPLSR